MSSFDYHESKFTNEEWKEIEKNQKPIYELVKEGRELSKEIHKLIEDFTKKIPEIYHDFLLTDEIQTPKDLK